MSFTNPIDLINFNSHEIRWNLKKQEPRTNPPKSKVDLVAQQVVQAIDLSPPQHQEQRNQLSIASHIRSLLAQSPSASSDNLQPLTTPAPSPRHSGNKVPKAAQEGPPRNPRPRQKQKLTPRFQSLNLPPSMTSPSSNVQDSNISHEALCLEEIEKTSANQLLSAISQDPDNGLLYLNLALLMDYKKIPSALILLKNCSSKDILLKAVSRPFFSSRALSLACNNFGIKLAEDKEESAYLENGTTMKLREFFITAIEHDSSNASAYNNLGVNLEKEETVNLSGKTLSQQELFLQAIFLDPMSAPAYSNLGKTLNPEESIMLPDETTATQMDLFQKTCLLNPNMSSYYKHIFDQPF